MAHDGTDYNKILEMFDCDVFVIEVKEHPIVEDSIVCLTPYNTKTRSWVSGMNLITVMNELFTGKIPFLVYRTDRELVEFLNKNGGKADEIDETKADSRN